ncbi:MAG: TatD family hydrolase [Phycisphaeraceae bacterium]
MIDTHCHLTYDGLAERLDEVLAGAQQDGVDTMISIGTTLTDSASALQVAEHHAHVHATVGVHPHHAAQVGDEQAFLDEFRRLAHRQGVVSLGEMGLDCHYDDPPLTTQERAFALQLGLAAESGLDKLPIVIHNREATDRTIAMVRESGLDPRRFVFHCFTGTVDELNKVLDLGVYVGFTGIVTFRSAAALAEASDRVPIDRLLVETDSPYLTPEPHRKVRPNEPRYVTHVARFLAKRRKMSFEAFVQQVDDNARRFYRLTKND